MIDFIIIFVLAYLTIGFFVAIWHGKNRIKRYENKWWWKRYKYICYIECLLLWPKYFSKTHCDKKVCIDVKLIRNGKKCDNKCDLFLEEEGRCVLYQKSLIHKDGCFYRCQECFDKFN